MDGGIEIEEVWRGFSGWVWLAFFLILFMAVRWGCGLPPFRSVVASAILLILQPLTAFVTVLALEFIVPEWIAALLHLVGWTVIAIAVVAYGFRAGLTRRVVAALVAAHIAMFAVGTVEQIAEGWPEL